MTPLTIIRKVKTWLNREVQIYNRYSGICQECGLPLDGFEWVIHKGKYEDCIITDVFNIVRKYQSKKDKAGNCYDWYIIDNHFRYIDKYTPNIGKVEERINGEISDTNSGLMETYDLTALNTDDIADCRTAIEELYEMIEEA